MKSVLQSMAILISPVLLAWSAVAHAGGGTPVVVGTEAPQGQQTTLNLQSSQGSACAAPTVGLCGSCSVSCPTGKAATCKPGLAVGPQSNASCLTPPECSCK
ncbi:MAG: hypothetical protein QJR02_05205 [Sinobacteraceae bacterium]|nr:hypothetical protein [Nevskiaceae bacterium]